MKQNISLGAIIYFIFFKRSVWRVQLTNTLFVYP